jgi:23S rRNA pseudouridine2605 synthase
VIKTRGVFIKQERLQKLIAQAGIASRRAAEELIKAGDVTVNGEIVTELGTKADPERDHIKVKGKLINPALASRSNVYILLNKPRGYLSSAADPEGRKLVTDLVKGYGRLHPVGRLDYNTEGLIILTNDGDFTNYVASSKSIPKVYEVKVKGMPTPVAINKLRRGVLLEDGFKTAPADIKELNHTDKNGWYEVTLYEGHNQQIRKMFDAIGHSVVKLKRIAIGSISDPYLKVAESRKLTPQEVAEVGQSAPVKRRAQLTKSPRGSDAASRKMAPRDTRPATRRSKPKRGARPSGKGPGRP